MKKIGEYTTRGKLNEDESEKEPHKIPLFDGRFDTAFRVTAFYIWPSTFSASTTSDIVGKLATQPGLNDGPVNFFDAEDNREIAWAGTGSDSVDTWGQNQNMIIDTDNLVVEDLYVYVRGALDAADVCYMITMEKYEISDWQGALALVRNRSQA